MLKCYVRGDPPAVFPKKRSVLLAAVVLLVCCCLVVPAAAAENITELLELEDTSAGVYELTKDITIQASELNALTDRDFSGSLDGGGHTITITGDEPAVSLFENVTGSGDGIRNLKIIFEGSVLGAPFAKNITNTPGQVLSLTDISVTVNGDILPADHDYLKYVGKGLTGSGGYGNWYIHFGGEPKHLATGFAWYILGATVQNVSVDIKGDIGTSEKQNQDTTSTGFAYFALRGTDTTLDPSKITYHDISISVGGSIQSKVSDGYSGAYGFAVGISDNSMMGGLYLGEVENVSISVTKDISAYTEKGCSNAFGFARRTHGSIDDCTITVTNISAFTVEENSSNIHPPTGGYAWASGFIYSNVPGPNPNLGSLRHNTIHVTGDITAKSMSTSPSTSSVSLTTTAIAVGFADELRSPNENCVDLTYQGNTVIVGGSLTADISNAKSGKAYACGFIRFIDNSNYFNENTFIENSITVGKSISAKNGNDKGAEAAAAGFAYSGKVVKSCDVTVGGDISAVSPTQAIASGLVGFQHFRGSSSFSEDNVVFVGGDISASPAADSSFASGMIAIIMSRGLPASISNNLITVKGDIFSSGIAGQIIAFDNVNTANSVTFKNNTFVGNEAFIEIDESDKGTYPDTYTSFTGFIRSNTLSEDGSNSVQFIRDDGVRYTSPVTLAAVSGSKYTDLWKVNPPQFFTITATAGSNGSITPSGGVSVDAGSDQTFTFMPDDGYTVAEVCVDDEVVTPSSSYTFKNVQTDHTIHVTFTQKPTPPVPIPPSGGGSSDGNMDNAFRVLFNDGTTTLFVVTDLSYGDKLTKPEDPVKDGYTFAGWHKDAACTQAWDFADGITGDMTLYAKWTPVQTVTPTVTPTATASVTPTGTAEPSGLPTTTPTVQPTGEDDGGKPAGTVLPLIGGILILILAVLLLLFLLLRHTVTFLIPAGGEITEYRIKVWHGRYIDPADLPELLRTAVWYRDPARRERWDFNEDRVTKSIELYLG